MTCGSLFSGIGGFELGLIWSGLVKPHEIKWQVEIDDFCNKVLEKHFPHVKRYKDIKDVGKHNLEPVELICGGFPCQKWSTAHHGKAVGIDLRPSFARIIGEIHPRIIIGENVSRQAIYGFGDLVKTQKYNIAITKLSAAKIGADHKRNRWWLIAHPYDEGKFQSYINAKVEKLCKVDRNIWGWYNYARTIRISNGIPHRMDRIKSLGNAVVPHVVQAIGYIIKEYAMQH